MSDTSSAPNEPWTVARLLNWTVEHFTRCNVDEPRLAAEILLSHALQQPRLHLYTHFETVPTERQRAAFRDLVKKAAAQTPVAYLIGRKEFYSLDFKVTPDVLIPRPETEALVEKAIELAGGRATGVFHALDIGTGSGCIAIATLANALQARFVASDISEAALAVARQNAETAGVADRITFVQANLLDLPDDVVPPGGFDLIASNPPYVAEADLPTLPACVREHEPAAALTPGSDGLACYRQIAAGAAAMLAADGHVLVEIGAGQRDAVLAVFVEAGLLSHVGTYKNPTDPHDRVLHFAKMC